MSDLSLTEALGLIPSRSAARPSAADRVAGALREQIVNGTLKSGTRLTEETIASALGYSRNTIRESLVLLVSERLAVREANRGVFVATPTLDDLHDLYRTRRLLEPAALEHGPGYTPEAVGRLRRIVDEAMEARARGEESAVSQANQEFHRAVAGWSQSRRVDQLMEGILAEMRLVFHIGGEDPGFHAAYLDRNDLIVRLLESGDRVEAARVLREYLTDAEHELIARLETSGPAVRDRPSRGRGRPLTRS